MKALHVGALAVCLSPRRAVLFACQVFWQHCQHHQGLFSACVQESLEQGQWA